ncbi:hypothetical protein BH23ACI1_BH23ACI1_10460 [soil metagenome]
MTRRPETLRALAAFVFFVALAALYTHPVLVRSGTAIASDSYDPVLNASILWWNATTVPFSPSWWTPPHFYPSDGIAAFTENLVGLWPVATPLLWVTGDPLRTYNLVLFLTWPFSAFAAYLLVLTLTRRHDAGLVAGLAFGFAPYRATQIAHLQVLACFWLPLALIGLHKFSGDPRRQWLVLFGAAWLLQALTNGYFMLFGAIIIALWLAYFCSRPACRRLAVPIAVAWMLASLPLVPVLLQYRAIHERYGLGRSTTEALLYSAPAAGWVSASPLLAVWSTVLPEGMPETNLFPGLTAVALVVLVGGCLTARTLRERASGWQAPARWAAFALAALGTAGALALLLLGPWRTTALGFSLRMSGLDRALLAAAAGSIGLVALTPGLRAAWHRRSPFAFYALTTLLVALFCMGPIVRASDRVILDPAPYAWLMVLPGFESLRVPARFWMLGALCLATAAGLAFARVVPRRGWSATALVLLACAGLLMDGWVREMPTAPAPVQWPVLERREVGHAVLELPLGPDFDAAATYRAVGHRRRVVNGVSGYDPPHYGPLQHGLAAHDPDVLHALTSFGPLDVVVDGWNDPDGALERYVSALPGTIRVQRQDRRTLFSVPATAPLGSPASAPWPIAGAAASDDPGGAIRAVDGNSRTAWRVDPQLPGQWLRVDLGDIRMVAAVVQSLGGEADAYPRYLEVHTSVDGASWQDAWRGSTLRHALSGSMRAPLDAQMMFGFSPRLARFVRLQAGAIHARPWSVAEVRVHGPEDSGSADGGRR